MNGEQILKLICDNTGKRVSLCNFTLEELKDFARAVLELYEGDLRDEIELEHQQAEEYWRTH